MKDSEPFTPAEDSLKLRVRVQPGAKRNLILGGTDGELRVRLTARPVEGAANEALIALLARTLGVPKRAVRIISGHSSRSKVISIETPDPGGVMLRLIQQKPHE